MTVVAPIDQGHTRQYPPAFWVHLVLLATSPHILGPIAPHSVRLVVESAFDRVPVAGQGLLLEQCFVIFKRFREIIDL